MDGSGDIRYDKAKTDALYSQSLEDQVVVDTSIIKAKNAEIERLTNEVTIANGRERQAFITGYKCGADPEDLEHAWQQYRCQDDTDWVACELHGEHQTIGEDCEYCEIAEAFGDPVSDTPKLQET